MSEDPKPLSGRLAKRLLAYATVAGASVAAGASDAQAEVVYTPVHSRIYQDFPIDLNHDGITDFHITSYDFSGLGELAVYPLVQGNRVAATPEVCKFQPGGAAALPRGAVIGPSGRFEAQANCMAWGFRSVSSTSDGAWVSAKNRYLGFAFVIDGKEHFGWARLSMGKFIFEELGVITGYAYETVPGKPIIAGDEGNATKTSLNPATLGALALGAPAMNLWRRQDGPEQTCCGVEA
jgi:hypothetical protein